MDDYNAQAATLAGRYGGAIEVCRLRKVRRRGLLVRFCFWPNFAAAVLPHCDVVALTQFDLVDGRPAEPAVLGYVSRRALLAALGDRVARRRAPVRHLVLPAPLDGEAQYRLLRHVRPDLKSAAEDMLEEA